MIFDFCIIGAGIVGLSTAMQLQQRFQHASIVVLEKEAAPALHQTGRNSGVIHAGVYYAPGSLKARFCREGSERTMAFCRENSIPYEQCGKLIVATSRAELARLGDLETRARANGLEPLRLDGEQLAEREPEISGLGALLIRETGIVDYGAVCRGIVERFTAAGGEIRFSAVCRGFKEHPGEVEIDTDGGTLRARSVITCAGVQSDRMARQAGLDIDFRIVPFRGDYFRLRSERNAIIRHLIYPVPDPALPFLGVHLTRMIGGFVTVGPNAALSFAREGYSRLSLNFADSIDLATFPGFWRAIWSNRTSAVDELHSALSRRRYLALCRKYCPSLTLDDLEPYPSGIRAQAVKADGTLVHDFLIVQTARTTHVCNAPSPAATAALPIGAYIVDTVAEKLAHSG